MERTADITTPRGVRDSRPCRPPRQVAAAPLRRSNIPRHVGGERRDRLAPDQQQQGAARPDRAGHAAQRAHHPGRATWSSQALFARNATGSGRRSATRPSWSSTPGQRIGSWPCRTAHHGHRAGMDFGRSAGLCTRTGGGRVRLAGARARLV